MNVYYLGPCSHGTYVVDKICRLDSASRSLTKDNCISDYTELLSQGPQVASNQKGEERIGNVAKSWEAEIPREHLLA